MSSPSILLGPVVGHVTTSTAIILLEVDSDVTLTCNLVKKNNPNNTPPIVTTAQFTSRSPRVFKYQGLDEGTAYEFSIPEISDSTILGSFRTFEKDQTKFNIAAVSCDRPKDKTGEMWPSLAQEVETIDMVLHMGDNVYIDEDVTGTVIHLALNLIFKLFIFEMNAPIKWYVGT